MEYIAHRREDTNETQTIKKHSEQTAALAEGFAIAPMQSVARACGVRHDDGKYQRSFQRRMDDPSVRAPHAFCGAQAVKSDFGLQCAGLMMAYVIAGHHAGIPDYGAKSDIADDPTLWGNFRRVAEDYAESRKQLPTPPVDDEGLAAYLKRDCVTRADEAEKFAFFTRYLFSCLTDADSLDTERFCEGRERKAPTADFKACLARVDARLTGFECVTALQRARARLQKQAFDKLDIIAPIYLLNMPTGSGKTLCALKFALERALRAGKKRLIFVIPYNSIIDQTALEFERVLGDAAVVLRHQSSYVYEDEQSLCEEERVSRTKATENWDAPVVITTAVQFFESMYGDRRSKLRRLHNMQDAMLVLDEAHLLPREYLQPCLKGISFLTKYLNSEALLLTATMPDYRELFSHFGVPGLETVDLIDDRADFALFRKCRYTRLGVISDAALLERACAAPSCLVVVNGRKAARALYTACPSTRKFHLSTWMTTLDRKRVIDEVRAALADIAERYRDVRDVPRDERVIVFSTSLIEAGVDFDFYTVFRELSGLDSILQAGGRCNREGRRDMADVYVFEREESVGRRDGDARASVTRELLDRYAQPDSPECVQAYYARLYAAHEDELTRRSIVRFAMDMDVFNESKPYHLPFRSYSRAFVMIDAPTYSIAVPQDDESRALIARLPYAPSAKTLRSLQKYCCSVSPGDFRALLAQRLVDVSESGVGYLKDESAYQRDTGIQFECRDMYY